MIAMVNAYAYRYIYTYQYAYTLLIDNYFCKSNVTEI